MWSCGIALVLDIVVELSSNVILVCDDMQLSLHLVCDDMPLSLHLVCDHLILSYNLMPLCGIEFMIVVK